jgi:hypothetical protein
MFITEEIGEKNTRQPYLQSYVIPDMKKKKMHNKKEEHSNLAE